MTVAWWSGCHRDCPGTGWLLIEDIDTGSEAGSFAGQPLHTSMSATLSVASGDLSLTGSVSVGAIQIAGDSEEETDCAVSDGDEDDDGSVHLAVIAFKGV